MAGTRSTSNPGSALAGDEQGTRMPKRRRDEHGGGSTAEPRQQHLYLVFDDWDSGYSIRKVKKFPLPSASGEGAEPQRLPRPFMRLAAHRGMPDCFTSAFGSKIMGLQHNGFAVQIIDVHTRSVLFGPMSNYPAFPIYFPIGGDKLIAMDGGSFELCCMPGTNDGGQWWWQQLPKSPFSRLDVTSYAMLSDGVTILFSTNGDNGTATFTFDTTRFVWTHLGGWKLPFTGRGHFDPDLHALVGLSKDPENLGYLFACDLPRTGKRCCPVPAWKRSKEKVFSNNPADSHVGATLVYMGHQCKFLLVECVSVEVKEDRYMYRLMTFTLKYDKKDNLRVKQGQVQYYKVPKEATTDFICADPVSFWL